SHARRMLSETKPSRRDTWDVATRSPRRSSAARISSSVGCVESDTDASWLRAAPPRSSWRRGLLGKQREYRRALHGAEGPRERARERTHTGANPPSVRATVRNAPLCYRASRETRARLRPVVRVRGLVCPGTGRVTGDERAPLLRLARRSRRTGAAVQPRQRARAARPGHDERPARWPVRAPRVRGAHHVGSADARAAAGAGVPLGDERRRAHLHVPPAARADVGGRSAADV